MSRLKKAFLIYLVVSSVILHCIVVYVTFAFALPAISAGREWADDFARASAGQAANLGIVKDISTLTEDEHTYEGYAVDYKGQTLYVMGGPPGDIKIGDEVAVTISKHPYGPLKGLLVTVMKNGSRRQP